MRSKQLVQKKLLELANFLNGQRALISTSRPKEEIFRQLDIVEEKLKEIEILVNRENENWN